MLRKWRALALCFAAVPLDSDYHIPDTNPLYYCDRLSGQGRRAVLCWHSKAGKRREKSIPCEEASQPLAKWFGRLLV